MTPRLPRRVFSPAGPVKVLRQSRLTDEDGDSVLGLWDERSRTIYIDRTLSYEAGMLTLEHEKIHAWLADLGLQAVLSVELTELLADALATARCNERYWLVGKKETN